MCPAELRPRGWGAARTLAGCLSIFGQSARCTANSRSVLIAAIEARVSESGTREMDRVRIRFAPAVGQADFQPGGQTTEPATDDIVLATLEA